MSWNEKNMAALKTWKGPQDMWPDTARLAFRQEIRTCIVDESDQFVGAANGDV